MEILDGLVEAVIFKSEDTGYVVAKITANKEVNTIVGTMPLIKEGQQIEVKGEWIKHKQFGRQFNVEEYKEVLPTSTKEIEKYLSTGIIHGIGPVTAKKIVKAFGEETLGEPEATYYEESVTVKVKENEEEKQQKVKTIDELLEDTSDVTIDVDEKNSVEDKNNKELANEVKEGIKKVAQKRATKKK